MTEEHCPQCVLRKMIKNYLGSEGCKKRNGADFYGVGYLR